MIDVKMRLISMLGVITIVVLVGLLLEYFQVIRRPKKLGLGLALAGLVSGGLLTLSAVLPENDVFGQVFSQGNRTAKVVALTFDDGPYPPYTDQILDILKENQVPATFFVVGKNAAKHPELVKRMADEGHQIGNHTYNHVDLLKMDRKSIANEVDSTSRVIGEITGQLPGTVRPPHGFRDPVVMDIMAARHLQVVEWSVMSRDWTNPGVDAIVERTVSKVENGSVVLLHDGDGIAARDSRAQTVEAVRRVIPILRAKGYQFVKVADILHTTEDTKQ